MAAKLSPDPRVQVFAKDVMEKQSAPGFIVALKAMATREEAMSLLRLLDYAIVIVHGAADALIPVERAREMKEVVPHAEYVELPGVGHLPMLEAAERTAQALMAFK
jgi:pimeloyl-ACP methyl ester carboxylesterase